MRHIKIKYNNEKKLEEGAIEKLKQTHLPVQLEDVHKMRIDKNQKAYLFTDRGTAIHAFIDKIDGVQYFIPEPDPVLIYFNNAQSNYRQIEAERKKLKEGLLFKQGQVSINDIEKKLSSYLYYSTGFVIFLFMSIEAMINKSIKQEYVYRVSGNKSTTEYNYEQIQRYVPFDEKIEKVLTENLHKNFVKDHSVKYDLVRHLKDVRDIIIHTKPAKDAHTPYSDMIKKLLKLKYKETIFAVRDLINYYQPNLIEECNCGKEF